MMLLATLPARIHRSRDLLVIEASEELGVASTTVLGGGLHRGRCIVSVRVSAAYDGDDPARDIARVASRYGWSPDVGLMTAVPLDRARVAAAGAGEVRAVAAVSAGVGRPWAAGSTSGPHPLAGTINAIVLLDRAVTPAAALNLVATVTEAKVLGLLEAGVRTAEGEAASGTATDAVVVAWPLARPALDYGGPATEAGWAAAAAVRQALREALDA